ncbi:MAG: N-acetylmuramoyl-L-alanine amidase [Candidatus Eremiobacteraeota bacterium]|nr:N-acetylmuramoyl-L-alanine amidase [Candidatus Eremiobacteraeota bacterium]
MHHPIALAQPVSIRDWRPELPPGELRSISLHWTAHDYEQVFPAYHFVLTRPDDVVVHHTHDLRENMRDVRLDPALPYAPHTRGGNSWSIGLSIAAMRGATPSDFGAYPLTEPQLDALCRVAATLAAFYGIGVANVRTHAEAALADGYFGAGLESTRWDIARLRPSPEPLLPDEATATGDWFRNRIAGLLAKRR